MFEHYILGIPRQPLPLSVDTLPSLAKGASFSPGTLSNISPGTCLPPSTSYFPLLPERRPFTRRLSSLDGLESALEKMERGNTIEKDEVDSGLCLTPEREQEMILGIEEGCEDKLHKPEKLQSTGDCMAKRRNLRGKETRRLAMIEQQVGGGSVEEFVYELRRRDEVYGLAFRTRVKEVKEDYICREKTPHTLKEPQVLCNAGAEKKAVVAEDTRVEFGQERRHSGYPSPPHEPFELLDGFEEQPRSRSSGVNEPRAYSLKEYSSPTAKAHILRGRKSFSNGGVSHARVYKRICQRRGT